MGSFLHEQSSVFPINVKVVCRSNTQSWFQAILGSPTCVDSLGVKSAGCENDWQHLHHHLYLQSRRRKTTETQLWAYVSNHEFQMKTDSNMKQFGDLIESLLCYQDVWVWWTIPMPSLRKTGIKPPALGHGAEDQCSLESWNSIQYFGISWIRIWDSDHQYQNALMLVTE